MKLLCFRFGGILRSMASFAFGTCRPKITGKRRYCRISVMEALGPGPSSIGGIRRPGPVVAA